MAEGSHGVSGVAIGLLGLGFRAMEEFPEDGEKRRVGDDVGAGLVGDRAFSKRAGVDPKSMYDRLTFYINDMIDPAGDGENLAGRNRRPDRLARYRVIPHVQRASIDHDVDLVVFVVVHARLGSSPARNWSPRIIPRGRVLRGLIEREEHVARIQRGEPMHELAEADAESGGFAQGNDQPV